MPAEAHRGDLQSAKSVPRYNFYPSLYTTPPPPHSQWMAPLTLSAAKSVGHMTVQATPPRHGHEPSKHINEGRKGEEESQADQT